MDAKINNSRQILWMTLLGVFSTTPIITIPLGPIDVQVFRILFYGTIIYMVLNTIRYGYIRIGKYTLKLDYWLGWAIISCLLGGIVFSESYISFSNMAISFLPKIGAFLILSLLWANQIPNNAIKNSEAIIKGIMIGCIINLLWASVDAAGFYISGKSINNIFFSGYITRHGIRYNMLSLIDSRTGLFRAAGFNSDPAQIGFMAPIIIFYGLHEKDIRYVGIAAMGIVASASTTALVSSLIIAVIYLIETKGVHFIITSKKIYRFTALFILLFITVIIFGDRIISIFIHALTRFSGRLNSTQFRSISAQNRWFYIIYAPAAFINLGILGLFGTGFGTSSWGYVTDYRVLRLIGVGNYFAYDPENTYIAYLFDTGIIGFCFFISIMITLIKHYRSNIYQWHRKFDIAEYACILSTALSMFFYHYILFTPQMLIILVGLTVADAKMKSYK